MTNWMDTQFIILLGFFVVSSFAGWFLYRRASKRELAAQRDLVVMVSVMIIALARSGTISERVARTVYNELFENQNPSVERLIWYHGQLKYALQHLGDD